MCRSEDFSLIPKNVGEVNNSCFIKLVTGGILGLLSPRDMIHSRRYGRRFRFLPGLAFSDDESHGVAAYGPGAARKGVCRV